MNEQRIYREVFSSDTNARYIDMVLVDDVWLDAIHPPLPEQVKAEVRAIVAREHAEHLLRMPDDGQVN